LTHFGVPALVPQSKGVAQGKGGAPRQRVAPGQGPPGPLAPCPPGSLASWPPSLLASCPPNSSAAAHDRLGRRLCWANRAHLFPTSKQFAFTSKQFASTSAYRSKRRHRINIPRAARFHPEASAPPRLSSAVHSIGMNFRKSKKQKTPPADRCTFSPENPFDFLLHFQCFIPILLCLCDQMGRGIKSSFRDKVTDSG